MKNGTLSIEGFASLQACEMEGINGGALLKIPSGLTWKALAEFAIEHYDEIKKGLVEGWNFDQK